MSGIYVREMAYAKTPLLGNIIIYYHVNLARFHYIPLAQALRQHIHENELSKNTHVGKQIGLMWNPQDWGIGQEIVNITTNIISQSTSLLMKTRGDVSDAFSFNRWRKAIGPWGSA